MDTSWNWGTVMRCDGRDERMSLTSFYEGQVFLYELE
jgi:hypothetical protein